LRRKAAKQRPGVVGLTRDTRDPVPKRRLIRSPDSPERLFGWRRGCRLVESSRRSGSVRGVWSRSRRRCLAGRRGLFSLAAGGQERQDERGDHDERTGMNLHKASPPMMNESTGMDVEGI
jgi:hypothetical protein